MQTAHEIESLLNAAANKAKADVLERFFKTGPGDYGEGDVFLGVPVPRLRKITKPFTSISLKELSSLLKSPVHECRLAALLILTEQCKKADEARHRDIVAFYCARAHRVNNWDLVDLSAPKILGPWFLPRDKGPLYDFARSDNLWKQRIAIVTTHHFIKNGAFEDTFAIADMLMQHPHDLIHKAVGWMIREVGKKDPEAEKKYLENRYKKMPRTMLRYAIEKFDHDLRQQYMQYKI